MEHRSVRIELLMGRALVNDSSIALSRRELDCVAGLVFNGPCGLARLADLLFPEITFDAAEARVRVYIHRLRRRLGAGSVLHELGVYRLASELTIDALEFERGLLDDARQGNCLLELAQRCLSCAADCLGRWPWAFGWVTRVTQSAQDAVLNCARDAIVQNNFQAAIEIARIVTGIDPCNEEAREVVIEAQLRAGEHARALQEYRSYESVLRSELDLPPSPALRRTVAQYATTA